MSSRADLASRRTPQVTEARQSTGHEHLLWVISGRSPSDRTPYAVSLLRL